MATDTTTTPVRKLIKDFNAARRVSTPIIGVQTPDAAATIDNLTKAANGDTPVLAHDLCRGIVGVNELGKRVAQQNSIDPVTTTNPVEALSAILRLPSKSVVFFHNAHLLIKDATTGAPNLAVVQAIWNTRDEFKMNSRMLVLLAPSLRLTPELENDVVVFDEPLPTADEMRQIILMQHKNAGLPAPTDAVLQQAIDATTGLAEFTAEQIVAMSLTKNGIDVDNLWDRKRVAIAQTKGLSVYDGKEQFTDVGGCENVKAFVQRKLDGREPPRGIVFIDEIEKAMSGIGAGGGPGDSSGTSQDQLGTLLKFMQDKNADGMMFIGHPGSAKSMIAKATGNTAGIPTIEFDLGAMKGSLVGQSEDQIRNALKVVEAVTQGRALFIATCNQIGALPPELRRRFRKGTFFFDLPTQVERARIWAIYLKKYQIAKQALPADEGWTGAEIATCCHNAWEMNMTLVEAADYIVPIARAAKDKVEGLCNMADGKFISAAYPGTYTKTRTAQENKPLKGTRAITVQ